MYLCGMKDEKYLHLRLAVERRKIDIRMKSGFNIYIEGQYRSRIGG